MSDAIESSDDLTPTRRLGTCDVSAIGFGAMQLPGRGVFGPPKDRDQALKVLRRAMELGINHIDTAQYYGPDVANELIYSALHPYPADLVLVSKVGARRDQRGGWLPANTPEELRAGVEANLASLHVDQLGVVNLRCGEAGEPDDFFDDQVGAMAAMREAGMIAGVGVSNVSVAQLERARSITEIVCVQNAYNLRDRELRTGAGGVRNRCDCVCSLLPTGVGIWRLGGRHRGPSSDQRRAPARCNHCTGSTGMAAGTVCSDTPHPRDVVGRAPRGKRRQRVACSRRSGTPRARRTAGERDRVARRACGEGQVKKEASESSWLEGEKLEPPGGGCCEGAMEGSSGRMKACTLLDALLTSRLPASFKPQHHRPYRRLPILLAAGAVVLLASACGSSLRGNTPCSAYLSMDNANQQTTIVTVLQQFGNVSPGSAAVATTQRAASTYRSYPMLGISTVGGVFDSRPW